MPEHCVTPVTMTNICGFATVYLINRASTKSWLVMLYCHPDVIRVQGIWIFNYSRKNKGKNQHKLKLHASHDSTSPISWPTLCDKNGFVPVCDRLCSILQILHEWMHERLLDQTYMVRLNSFQTAIQGIRIVGVLTEQQGSYCSMSNRCLERQ